MESTTEKILLVVEDEPELRELIVNGLELPEVKIIEASNGQEGYEKTLLHDPIAILTDINMPIMSGLDMSKCIRKQGIETPIVILTAYSEKDFVIDALRNGIMDFINKPFELSALNEIMAQAVSYGEKLREFDRFWMDYIDQNPQLKNQKKTLLATKKEILKMRFISTSKKVA